MKEVNKSNLRKNFAVNVKKYRKELSLSQKEFADKIFYSEKTVSKWEKGGVIPPVETLYKIASFFGVSIDSLFFCDEERYFLGVDGGGTKTKVVLENLAGEKIKELVVGSSNPADIGIEKAIEILSNSIKNVLVGIPYGSVCAFIGVSGGTSMNNKQILEEYFATFGFNRYAIGNDVDNIISSGLDGDGVAVIMGTGIGILRKTGDKLDKIGGWGYLIDDGGSGYNFGRDALNAFYRDLDGSGESTIISKIIREKTGLSHSELLAKIYEIGKKYIASFCPVVFEAYEKGDKVATEILDKNISIACQYIRSAIKPFDKKVKVVLAGSIATIPVVFEKLKENLKEDNCELGLLGVEPVYGAVKRARSL